MTILASGFGAGDNQLEDRPNLTQVVVGTMAASRPAGQPVMLFATNVDDATGGNAGSHGGFAVGCGGLMTRGSRRLS